MCISSDLGFYQISLLWQSLEKSKRKQKRIMNETKVNYCNYAMSESIKIADKNIQNFTKEIKGSDSAWAYIYHVISE